MVTETIIFWVGIIVSVLNIYLWQIVIRSQLRQFRANRMNLYIKQILLFFSCVMVASNINPLWYDIYRLIHPSHLTNIGVAYIVGQYISRTVAAVMFYLIYRI